MRKIKELSRRTFLMQAGRGSFALLSEMTFGFGRRGLAVALGGSGLAVAACQPQGLPVASTGDMVAENMDSEEAALAYAQIFMEFVSAYVLIRGSEIAIVDTGTPGNIARFTDVIQSAGSSWANVNHVVLTHHHGDHVGGLSDILAEATASTVYAGEADIASIQSAQPIQGLLDGDEVFGMQVIGTPGHTPGHISVYDPVGSLLVAGDAIVNSEEGLGGPSPRFTDDMPAAVESAKKLAQYDYETLLMGHGQPLESGASKAVIDLAATLE